MFNKGKLSNTNGLLPNFSKQEKNENVQNLSKKNKIELEELRDRQLKILSNRMIILPDKGKKIQDFLLKIEKELANRNEIDQAAKMFSELNIASKGKNAINIMEWNGKYTQECKEALDSDDEEDIDPLKVLAQNRDVLKVISIIEPEVSLITENDIKEIESFKENSASANLVEVSLKDKTKFQKIQNYNTTSSLTVEQNPLISNLDAHVGYVCGMEYLGESKLKYKPYFTTKTNVHDPEKEKLRKKNYKWEITAATPPLFVHSKAQVLTLHDSIELQILQTEKLKKIQEEQATERLLKRSHRDVTDINISNTKATEFFRHYREVNDTSESESEYDEFQINSDDEVQDECDIPDGGTVNILH